MGEDEALKVLEVAREVALGRIAGSYLRLAEARQQWEEDVMRADHLGVGPSEIARHAGVSETAIRLFIKRRKAKQ